MAIAEQVNVAKIKPKIATNIIFFVDIIGSVHSYTL
jgi:hypothetical protein